MNLKLTIWKTVVSIITGLISAILFASVNFSIKQPEPNVTLEFNWISGLVMFIIIYLFWSLIQNKK